jgi:hypothetical protein
LLFLNILSVNLVRNQCPCGSIGPVPSPLVAFFSSASHWSSKHQALEGATFKLGWGSNQFNSLAHGYTLRKATMPYHAKDLAVFKASEEAHMTVLSGYITYFSKHRAKIIEE